MGNEFQIREALREKAQDAEWKPNKNRMSAETLCCCGRPERRYNTSYSNVECLEGQGGNRGIQSEATYFIFIYLFKSKRARKSLTLQWGKFMYIHKIQ